MRISRDPYSPYFLEGRWPITVYLDDRLLDQWVEVEEGVNGAPGRVMYLSTSHVAFGARAPVVVAEGQVHLLCHGQRDRLERHMHLRLQGW